MEELRGVHRLLNVITIALHSPQMSKIEFGGPVIQTAIGRSVTEM